jgi:hypothetical protein
MSERLKETVTQQKKRLKEKLNEPLSKLAEQLAPVMTNRESLENILSQSCERLIDCKYIYVLDAAGVQLTATVSRKDADDGQFGRDRSLRPYMSGMFGETNFRLSDVYISRRKRRPSLTAMRKIRDTSGKPLGFLGVDYDLRELPHTEELYKQDRQWQQIKGDPAIRGALFTQSRSQSVMDDHLEDVFSLMDELITEQGVFHGKLHFASSRATIWHVDDPYDYRILTVEELIDPDTCLAYPRRPYFERATVPADMIMPIFRQFGALRFADETIYLRAGSINIVNGMVGLNFSCDGSHYIHWQEFLDKGLEFWFGTGA